MDLETTNKKRTIFYHQQRVFWPLLAGAAAFLLAQNDLVPGENRAIPAFITYVVTGLFYDWLVFNYLGYKDSDKLTNEQWQQHNVTHEQYDKLNEFLIMVRRCAFAASVSATAMCALFFPQASLMGTFFFAYAGITILFISIGVLTKEIVFKYTSGNVWAPPKKGKMVDPFSSNPALNPFWYTRVAIDPTSTDPALNPPGNKFY